MSDDSKDSTDTPTPILDNTVGCDGCCGWRGDAEDSVIVHTKPAVLNLRRACAARAIVMGWARLEAEVES